MRLVSWHHVFHQAIIGSDNGVSFEYVGVN